MKLVQERHIPHVHFLPFIYSEDEIWAFHSAIDVFAHFRYDGESCGLSIAESMLVGNPIISHRSRIWNAHLEYLTPDNSFVVDVDDVDAYSIAMQSFGNDADGKLRKNMGIVAQQKAQELFHIEAYMQKLTPLIEDSLRK